MKGFVFVFCFVAFAGLAVAWAGEVPEGPVAIDWDRLSRLPDREGFAGCFAGVSEVPAGSALGDSDVLVVAGGANFPAGRPWEGGTKVWYDDVFVLADPEGEWLSGFKLARPLGYGVSVSIDRGVVCLGGGDADSHSDEVFLLEWTGEAIRVVALPSMPGTAAFFCGARLGDSIYVAGGREEPDAARAMKTFWALRLKEDLSESAWEELEPWPGPGRMQAVAGVQGGEFFLFGGVELDPNLPGDDKRVFLTDGYRYAPGKGEWTAIARLPRAAVAAPSPAMALGQSHLAVIGGDDGANVGRAAELMDSHPGFPGDIFLYHTLTDTWVRAGQFADGIEGETSPAVTTNTTWWRGRYVIPSGEVRPGVRTPEVVWGGPRKITQGFGVFDYGVLVAYLAVLVAMGIYFSMREKSTRDFFLGGHRIPWWAAGLSIFGTQLSAITFMAVPAKSFRADWVYFMANMMIVAMAPLVIYCYLPFFRQLDITSAYEYLEKRFSKSVRLLGSATFVLFQLGRMAIIVFLPALALSTVTGISVELCILVMGVLATTYTVLGGIEAVIWTDVLQVFVLLGGAVASLVIIVLSVDGGFGTLYTMAHDAGKLRVADFGWDYTAAVLWVVVLGSAFQQMVSYTSDQTVVQRYLTTADQKAAARGIWTNALLTIPATILFFGLGTALWAFYKTSPELLNPTGKSDDILPWFIAQQLPAGVAGLVLAALFAAAMSSLDSSMNSMATAITTDYYRWFRPHASDGRCLKVARWLTVLLGLFGTGSALVLAQFDTMSMWDQYIKVVGLFGGGLAGMFALGIFTRRATGTGAIVGFVASAGLLAILTTTDVHEFLYVLLSVPGCFVVGYVASLVLPGRTGDLDGLTLHTLNRAGPAAG